MGSDESHFNVSVGSDSVHKPQPFWRERRAEAVSNRGPSAYQPNALPLGQTGSLYWYIINIKCYLTHLPIFYLCVSTCWWKMILRETGAGIAQWLEHRTRDWKVAGSNPCWNGGRIFFSRVDFLCWLLFRYPFHPRVTTVARKKSRSFCQKCRWQVTAKTRIHLTYVDFIEPCFGIGHNLSLICQMTSEDIKHQLIIII